MHRAYQSLLLLFQLDPSLIQLIRLLLHLNVRLQFLFPELCKIDDGAEIAAQSVSVWIAQVLGDQTICQACLENFHCKQSVIQIWPSACDVMGNLDAQTRFSHWHGRMNGQP